MKKITCDYLDIIGYLIIISFITGLILIINIAPSVDCNDESKKIPDIRFIEEVQEYHDDFYVITLKDKITGKRFMMTSNGGLLELEKGTSIPNE